MRKALLIITAVMLVLGCGSDSIKLDINNLIDRGGLMYAPNDDKPFTGIVFDFYENGEKELDGNYRKGLMNGEWTYYHENGQIHGEGRFIDGDGSNLSELSGIPFNGRSGRWKFWYENGQKWTEGTFKGIDEDGYPAKDGKYTVWYENGQRWTEGTYKDGELDGLWTSWYKNGQKEKEGTYKDGKLHGLLTGWHENGQKSLEGTYKDGELISSKIWNEDGSVKE